jgi:F-type H+-transporting ATPase subunit a
MYKQKVGIYHQKYFSFVFTLFIFILMANLVGLMPYGFTITSHLFTTFFFSFSIFVFLISTGLLLQGTKFFLLFVPTGVPPALLPFLIVIEVISYFARALSLAVRLFANMMAGHSLLNIIASFVLRILNNTY